MALVSKLKLAPWIYIFWSSIINTKSMEQELDKNMDKGQSTLASIYYGVHAMFSITTCKANFWICELRMFWNVHSITNLT
jgi:uncharacterized protein (UPF0332 family)